MDVNLENSGISQYLVEFINGTHEILKKKRKEKKRKNRNMESNK